jgi:hypothetical protein
MNSEKKPIYLGSFITKTANLTSRIYNSLTLDSRLDRSLSTVLYEQALINQPYRVNLETYLTLSLATILQLKYKKPDSTVFIKDADYSGSVLYYDFLGSEIDQLGVWTFQTLLDFPDQETISTWSILLEVKDTIA